MPDPLSYHDVVAVTIDRVATEIMGWTKETLLGISDLPIGDYWQDDGGVPRHEANAWDPLTNIADAFDVVEAMRAQLWELSLMCANGRGWMASMVHPDRAVACSPMTRTPAEAITRAALETLEKAI